MSRRVRACAAAGLMVVSVMTVGASAAQAGTTTTPLGGTTGPSPFGIVVDHDGSGVTADDGSNSVAGISAVLGPLVYSSGAFPPATVGKAAALTITVTNSGTGGPIQPTDIISAGTGVAVTGGTCAVGTLIPASGSCTVTLTWTPAAVGALTDASLLILYPGGAGSGEATVLTGTATIEPTPTPTPTPEPVTKTTLSVSAAAKDKQLPVNARSVLVRSVRSNGTVGERMSCALHGNRLSRRAAIRLCAVTTTEAANAGIRITAAPACNTGLRIRGVITAKKAGHPRARWTRTWKPDPTPRVPCRLHGTG